MIDQQYQYMVTVIVADYNPVWEKLEATIRSVLYQNYSDFEIIIVDDGSTDSYFIKLQQLFYKYNFFKYKLFSSSENKGTVENVWRAVEVSQGKYLRMMSPGDYLYSTESLSEWVEYADRHKYNITFGEAVYYTEKNGQTNIVDFRHSPWNIDLYCGDRNEKAINITFQELDDCILGASYLTRTELVKKYMPLLIGKVKLAEDQMYRLMVFNGEKIHYYPQKVVWYEFGTGVSTDKNGAKRMYREWSAANDIILSMRPQNIFSKRVQRLLLKRKQIKNQLIWFIYKSLFYPETVWWWFRERIKNNRTPQDADYTFYKKITLGDR